MTIALPPAADAARLTAALRAAGVLDAARVSHVTAMAPPIKELSALWLIMRPARQAMVGVHGGVWWNNLERIFLAVDGLGCRELLD